MPANRQIELWGGIECTVARIGDKFRNQSVETGHHNRIEDLDSIAHLGIRTVRYPILWETVTPHHAETPNWHWHDARLKRLATLGMTPIAGLLHHGSGPVGTDLLDPTFPEKLANYAGAVAARYPWIKFFTPINEPLTTARFSGLYGHWYPHRHDYTAFLRSLIHQCRAIVLAMRAIRLAIPDAQLIQTEDLGKVFSTPLLAYQADHENERRWLSYDLLCSHVNKDHPWFQIFRKHGTSTQDLAFFLSADCRPNIIGINHYLTSERYLDHQIHHYPSELWGTNGRHCYADTEAVRFNFPAQEIGLEARLRETWTRYGIPVAITETHHGCTRDEQLRWLIEAWTAAQKLLSEGIDIKAVTAWSLFGAVDWNTLLTQSNNHYESGAFDVRSNPPRPTALASAITSLVNTDTYKHPVLDRAGWWHRPDRCYDKTSLVNARGYNHAQPRQLLITGATGTLGRAFSRICNARGLDHVLSTRQDMDIANQSQVERTLMRCQPWAVINTAGYVRVVQAKHEADLCFRENVLGAEVLARACANLNIPYVTFSSDLVFDGRLRRAYKESDPTNPTCLYGITKADAERRIENAYSKALVIRTSAFFGPWDTYNFIYNVVSSLKANHSIAVSNTNVVSPTYIPDLVHATLDLLIDQETGVWHLANCGSSSWYELAQYIAQAMRLDTSCLRAINGESRNTTLTSERGILLPSLDNALDRYIRDTSSICFSAANSKNIELLRSG